MVADLGPGEGSWKALASWQMAGVRGAEVSITPLEVVSFSAEIPLTTRNSVYPASSLSGKGGTQKRA